MSDEQIRIEIERLKLRIERIASDAESEKDTRKRRNSEVDRQMEKIREVIYGNGKEGMNIRLTRLENEKESKRYLIPVIISLISSLIAAIALFLK